MFVTVKRLTDNKPFKIDVEPTTRVGELKRKLRAEFPPSNPQGCRLKFNGKVLKSIHRLKHYGIPDNGTIDMDDTKAWSSSSSSSDSD